MSCRRRQISFSALITVTMSSRSTKCSQIFSKVSYMKLKSSSDRMTAISQAYLATV